MRRRLPSPALVIASIALFLALGGAGFAASLALAPVKSSRPTVLVYGSMSASGKLIGGLSHGTERSTGVYTLTINGNTFATNKAIAPGQVVVSPQVITISGSGFEQKVPPTCSVASETILKNGSATAEVDCFTYNAATGWVPTPAGFDFQMLGPSH